MVFKSNSDPEEKQINMEEIEKSLREIRDICTKNDICTKCPFRTHGGGACMLDNRPDSWIFASEPDTNGPRLFR